MTVGWVGFTNPALCWIAHAGLVKPTQPTVLSRLSDCLGADLGRTPEGRVGWNPRSGFRRMSVSRDNLCNHPHSAGFQQRGWSTLLAVPPYRGWPTQLSAAHSGPFVLRADDASYVLDFNGEVAGSPPPTQAFEGRLFAGMTSKKSARELECC